MKQKAWLRALVLGWVTVGTLALVAGCGSKPFSVVERKTCKGIDPAGAPVDETTVFSTADTSAYIWFGYTGAEAGQAIKVKFTYTDPAGTMETQEKRTELMPGSGAASAQLNPLPGEALEPGRYEVEILDDAGVALGPALTFMVE